MVQLLSYPVLLFLCMYTSGIFAFSYLSLDKLGNFLRGSSTRPSTPPLRKNTSCLAEYGYNLPPRIEYHFGSSAKKLNVLVPMRGREIQLALFIPSFLKSMQYNAIDARIFVVEQKDKGPFNKGRLLNIGFSQANERGLAHKEANWLFSDVDIFETTPGRLAYRDCMANPDDSTVAQQSEIHHLYGIGGDPAQKKTYSEGVLGGLFCLSSAMYSSVNGFSNQFWGWGFEDSDFEHRIAAKGAAVNRGALIPRLGDHGDCFSELGLADLPTPKKQKEENPDAYNMKRNPNVPIHLENGKAYKKDLQAAIVIDGISSLVENQDYTMEKTNEDPRGFFRMRVALQSPRQQSPRQWPWQFWGFTWW